MSRASASPAFFLVSRNGFLLKDILDMGNSLSANDPFRREVCGPDITEGLQNGTITWNPLIFISVENVLNPIFTLYGCKKLCGSGTGWYPDIGPRLVTWFLPIFLLVSNLQFPLIGMERFLLILHLLGDPIDSNWSQLDKVRDWSHCYAEARKRLTDELDIKSLAVIDAARVEVQGSSEREREPTKVHDLPLIRKTAITLISYRSNEVLRTSFAVFMYVFQVVSAFVQAVGASSHPSGGMVGTAMLLSWLVCVCLLSNALGGLGPPDKIEEIIKEFMELNRQRIAHHSREKTSKLTIRCLGIRLRSKTSHGASLVWSGAINCYRPDKRLGNSGWKLAVVSVLPVAIAFGTAFAVLETGPTYFSCRHLLVIFAFVFWTFSTVLSYTLPRVNFANGKYLWYIILIKDFLFAAPILGLIVASSCGYWNTCACWGGAFVHGDKTQIQLNPTSVFNWNDYVEYPAMVATGITLQICIFLVMLVIGWDGFWALWWSEREKQKIASSNRSAPTPKDEYQLELRESSCLAMIEYKSGTEITYHAVNEDC
jgi:hypothetical protein